MKKSRTLQVKRQFITGKNMVGIDQAQAKHQAVVMDSNGAPTIRAFTFINSHEGCQIL